MPQSPTDYSQVIPIPNMVVKRIPCDFSQSMYVSQGTYKGKYIIGRKRQICRDKVFSLALIFYRGAIEGSEMVMSVDWAEESIHTVPLPTQLVILRIVRSKSRPLIGKYWPDLCPHWLIVARFGLPLVNYATHLMSNAKSSESPSFY